MLVTGGGGSIGSELCRQVAQLGAAKLVLVEQAESALYEMQRELVDERALHRRDPGARRLRRRREDAAGVRALPARGRLPRGRLQARADARDEPAPGGDQQRARDARDRAGLGRVRRRPLRLHLDRQGGEAEEPARPVEGGLRVDRRVVRPARRRRDPLRRGALRQRPRLVRVGDPDLPAADRARRPADGDEPRDDALLHDDPGGRLARDPGRRDGRQGPGLRSRHGPAGQDPRPRPADDRALRPHRGRHQDRVRRLAGRREDARGALERGRGDRRDLAPEDHARRQPADRAWPGSKSELAELELLVAENDMLGVTAKLRQMVAGPRRVGSAVLEDTLH